LLELAFVAGGAVLVGAGLYRSANSTSGGKAALRATRRVGAATARAAA
jgi:hypothetical protein